jgi:hypothetical protein
MNPWDDDRKQPSWFHAPRDPSLLLLVLAIAFGFLTGMSCQNGDALLPVRTANTALVIGIEEAGRALRAQVTKNAQERMALCDSLPEPAKVDCRITAVEKAIEDGTAPKLVAVRDLAAAQRGMALDLLDQMIKPEVLAQ